MSIVRCYVDFNTMMQFTDELDRVILSERESLRLGDELFDGSQVEVYDEDMSALGVAEWNARMSWWTVVIDPSSYRDYTG